MDSKSTNSNARQKLIAEIYEVALRPELYGDLVDLWESQLSEAVGRLKTLEDTVKGQPVLDDPELEDHFKRAYHILERMGRQPREAVTPDKYLEKHGEPCWLFDAKGLCVGFNDLAQEFQQNVTTLKDLEPKFMPDEWAALLQLKLRLSRPLSETDGLLLRSLTKNATGKEEYGRLFFAKPIRLDPTADHLLYIGELSIRWSDRLLDLLQTNFGLTGSEADVVKGLCHGQTVQEIAESRKRSAHTIRTQTKSIFQKMGCISQGDVIRHTMAMSIHIRNLNTNDPLTRFKLTSGERIQVDLGEGRSIPVNCFGPHDGQPVLFIHGMLDGFIFSEAISRQIEKYKFRLIAPSRSGFGECVLDYKPKTAPTDFAHDIKLILDHFEIGSCLAIGHMAGSVYTFAAEKILKNRIRRIVNISGGVPIERLSQFAAMSARQRVVAWTARFTPGLLPTLLRAGIAQIDSGDRESFMNALYPENSTDRKLVANPSIAAAVMEGYSFAVAQGHKAFEWDALHVTRNWSEYVIGTSCPVTLIHGTHDPVVDIGSVRKFAEKHDMITLHEFEDCGQLLIFKKPAKVFNIIASMNR